MRSSYALHVRSMMLQSYKRAAVLFVHSRYALQVRRGNMVKIMGFQNIPACSCIMHALSYALHVRHASVVHGMRLHNVPAWSCTMHTL
jgi:hypothetical protein